MRVRHRLKHLHVIVGGTDQQPGALPVTSAAPLAPKASNNSNPYHMVYRQLLKCTWEPAFQRYYRHFQRGITYAKPTSHRGFKPFRYLKLF